MRTTVIRLAACVRLIRMRLIAGFMAGCVSLPSAAHHSVAMYDVQKTVQVNGVVSGFQWTNPHCLIQVVVGDGEQRRQWSVELGSPGFLYRGGLRPNSLKPGDHLQVTMHPARDGASEGLYVSALLNGKPMPTLLTAGVTQ